MSQPDRPRPPTRHPQKTFPQRLFSVFVAELMSFPAAFFLIETLELFCAEDHQINFVHQQRSVHWMVTTNKQRRLGWSLSPGWHRYRTWQEGRREWEEEGKKNNNLWAAAVVVCSFFGKLEAEERAECFDRCSRAYVEFCWGKICSHNVTHFPPAASRQPHRARLPCRHHRARLRDVLTMARVLGLTRRSERVLLKNK